ncbi:hypothetical protein F4604DRAFT_1185119 [Suillus subluteus]|nr:hypothetical protein F4604DRAFT_1185119 [Suillus subluteus]
MFDRLLLGVLQRLLGQVGPSCPKRWQTLRAVHSFAERYRRLSFCVLRNCLRWLRCFVLCSQTKVVDSEAQSLDQNLDIVPKNQCLGLRLLDTPASSLEAPSIEWLLETFTDPEVFLAAASFVPQVEWPLDLDVSDNCRSCMIFTQAAWTFRTESYRRRRRRLPHVQWLFVIYIMDVLLRHFLPGVNSLVGEEETLTCLIR